MDRPEFIKDLANQRLYFSAPEGRPSATPSVEIKDSGGTVLTADATTFVTQDTVATTISATASKGATKVVVASAAGIAVGDPYRLKNKYEQVQWIVVKSIDGTTIEIVGELKYDFDKVVTASYGDFESARWYYTLQTADYDTLRELVVATAKYVVDGLDYRVRLVFDVVVTPLHNPLTAERMYQRWPDLARQEHDEQRGENYLPQRNEAWSIIKRRIRQTATDTGDRFGKRRKWRPAMVVDASDFYEAAMAQLKLLLQISGVDVDRDEPARDRLEELVELEWERAATSIAWLDLDEDETVDEGEESRLELDFVR